MHFGINYIGRMVFLWKVRPKGIFISESNILKFAAKWHSIILQPISE